MSYRKGFTLIELVVVIGVIALLTSILIIGLGGSRVKFNLLIERAHIVEAIYRAKSLAIQTYLDNLGNKACGYGIQFNYGDNTYFIYRDMEGWDINGDPDECRLSKGHDEAFTDSDGDAKIQVFALPTQYVKFYAEDDFLSENFLIIKSDDSLGAILFLPPDPNVRFVKDALVNTRRAEGFIVLQTVELTPEKIAICVSQEGAVSYKDCPPVFN